MQFIRLIIFSLTVLLVSTSTSAQELMANIDINTQKVEGTNKSVFDDLKTNLMQFMNERRWTNQEYDVNERIRCSISIVVNKYDAGSGAMTCEAYIQSSRPVFESSYLTTTLSIHDPDFSFEYHESDQLEFRDDQVNNNLTALMAYYAYLIIGIDLDTMAPKGGTEILQKALDVANNAQPLNAKGWKAFDKSSNRFGIINDYMDGGLEPFRQLQYDYHRKGLDNMTSNSDDARQAIKESILLLQEAHSNKSLSTLPRLFSEWKRDELVNIFNGKETSAKKQSVYDILLKINASSMTYWKKILQ